MIVFYRLDFIGKAERRRELDLVLRLVRPVSTATLGAYEVRRGERRVMRYLMNIVENAVFVNVFGNVKFISVLIAEAEGNAGVYNRLTVQDILKKLLGYINIGKHLEVWAPFDCGSGFLRSAGVIVSS